MQRSPHLGGCSYGTKKLWILPKRILPTRSISVDM